jgi:signal transduction histidine kinase
LTNLTLYLDLLARANHPAAQENYIQTLKLETRRLTHLIEDLLTISRLEAGRIQFQIRPIDINPLVETLVADRIFLTAQKEIRLEFFPTPDLPLAAIDENMLTQAISNLLTNAANYTQPGGSIRVTTSQPEPGWVAIQISDTGVGISPEECARIFDRFYRGRASHITGAEGTGLGLAISQEILQQMDGKITFESTPGEGSTFTLWLPEFVENLKNDR